MASHGRVLDLFDERCLKLQDVVGNVVPFPTLLPYADYCQNILVYKMETRHDIFIGQIQDFTDRLARQSGRELWSWFVQWEVEQLSARPDRRLAPLPKKPRTSPLPHIPLSGISSSSQAQASKSVSRERGPVYTTMEHRFIDPEFVKDEDMLRLLLDIVQVEPKLLPNFIELLYQYIDNLEGDGHALKCAMRHEIPSLWYFEKHPIIIEEVKKSYTTSLESKKTLTNSDKESERLQYREKKFGLQPPKIDQPVPSQINIPKDPDKYQKYHAACFKNRQRAIDLLLEAGVTEMQIKNYVKGQELHPKDTPEEGECEGLKYYEEDKPYYQKQLALKEHLVREKYIETLISGRLDSEAQQAARSATLEAIDRSTGFGLEGGPNNHLSVPAPIIPPAPHSAFDPHTNASATVQDSGDDLLVHSEPLRDQIDSVPQPLHRRLRSKLFACAIPIDSPGVLLDNNSNTEANREYDADDMGTMDETGDENDAPIVQNPATIQLQQDNHSPGGMAAYLRTLNLVQLQSVMQMMHQRAAQALTQQAFTNLSASPTPASQPAPLHAPALPAPSITVTAPAGPPSFSNAVDYLQVPNPQTQLATGSLVIQNPIGSGLQQTQLNPPALVNHSSLSPSFQNLSFEISASATIPNASTLLPATPATIQSINTPQIESFIDPSLPTPTIGLPRIHTTPAFKLPSTDTFNEPNVPDGLVPLTPQDIPVLLYFPRCLSEHSIIGTQENTDAVMLGYIKVWGDNSTIELTGAIFLPADIFGSLLRRVREGDYTVLESYPGIDLQARKLPYDNIAHRNAYSKLAQSFSLMTSTTTRELDLTKRWRVSPGMMTEIDRGAVWEGWGLTIDRKIAMGLDEREGAVVMDSVGRTIDWEAERRREEMDELMDEENWSDTEIDDEM